MNAKLGMGPHDLPGHFHRDLVFAGHVFAEASVKSAIHVDFFHLGQQRILEQKPRPALRRHCSVVPVGRHDNAGQNRAQRIDHYHPFTALDFLAPVEADFRRTRGRIFHALAVDDDDAWAGLFFSSSR